MKNNDKKFDIKEFVKNNYKLIIPIILMVVLFIAVFIFYHIYVNSDYKVDSEEKLYSYFSSKKYEYNAVVSKNRKDVIVDFKPKDIAINIDSTPIYYQEKDIVILPKDMSVVMPTLSCAEYLAKGYSYITYTDGIYKLTTDKYDKQLNHYFLYDGLDLYFFIESVTLTVGNEKIELAPFSYVIARYNKYISYYDKKSDTFRTIETTDDTVLVENDYYEIYVMRDTLDYQGTDVILTTGIEHLNTIDKKG